MKYGKRRERQKRKRQAESPGTSAETAASSSSAGTGESAEAAERQTGGLKIKPWWEQWEGRLEDERARLDALGIVNELDEEAFKKGAVILRLQADVEGEKVSLIAKFPDFYPYTRFEVEAPELDLSHHQGPFKKNLCLIGLDTENWNTNDTLAGFIRDRLPLVLKTGRSDNPDEVAGIEEEQGEPFGTYYPCQEDSIVLIDGAWSLDPSINRGEIVIGVKENSGELLRSAVLEIKDGVGQVIDQADPAIRSLHPRPLRCRWIRVNEPIKEEKAELFFEALFKLDSSLSNPQWKTVNNAQIDVIGVVFPEENSWRKNSDGWIFAVRCQRRSNRGKKREFVYLTRPGRAGRSDLAARIPELSSLHNRKVAIIGLGGVGWASAIELARNGVGQLRLLDYDFVEPGTTVRWALGLSSAGRQKTAALADFIRNNYPYTTVITHDHRIGGIFNEGISEKEVFENLLDGIDLLYDSTAEGGIQYLLSNLAAERDLPYICISTTPGAWGGRVVRVRPGKTSGCWFCWREATMDGTIPTPPSDPDKLVQPAGCASPTFTGTSFDIEEISLSGVRLAVSTLTEGIEGAYPEAKWDVGIVTLRENKKQLIAPKWQTFELNKHPSCICSKTE